MTEDLIQQWQDDVWGILNSDPGYRYVPVYRSRTPLLKDEAGEPIVGQTMMIEEEIEQALAGMITKDGKSGIVAIVMLPDARPVSAQSVGPSLEMTLVVRFIEDRLINESVNGTGISSSQLGLHTLQLLHRRSLRGSHAMYPPDRDVLNEISLPDERKAHELRMILSRGMVPLPKVAKPVVSIAAGALTASCATEESQIWWSGDGTWPGPHSATSHLYEESVALDENITEVRVVAYAAGMQASDDVLDEV